ncbi:histidine kinase [Algoriphagus sp. AGSA1]|uniref:sensor histidine kinase n=1 Tax=Algoriphagus sp. AGSA1 TaxID=2907213 RepID=UPI001F3523A8|nr:histidine kinase [Algoriphagus sp. AGSA1]MCE7054921.1 histidine kinase [Algoriphagus sp. AGSA1]
MEKLRIYSENQVLKHVLFWIAVYLYFVLSVSNISSYESHRHIIETYGLILLVQIITAYVCIYGLIPTFLDKKQTGLFVFWMLVLLISMFALYQAIRMLYFDVVYFDSYDEIQKKYAEEPYWKRISSFSVFLSKSILYLTPTALLLMARFYKNQQKLLKLNEQKRTAELTALRNQLNPHFLFNTLNNIYALALEKSEKTPEVIERLSDILDYILYRCNENYVPVQKEIELIENYLSLEKIRYGDRVDVNFVHKAESDLNIAPLLLLTFVENAFKHGVTQELKKAKITISITTNQTDLLFTISNSMPANTLEKCRENEEQLGLKNVKKQLELLYPDSYELALSERTYNYEVLLKLKRK